MAQHLIFVRGGFLRLQLKWSPPTAYQLRTSKISSPTNVWAQLANQKHLYPITGIFVSSFRAVQNPLPVFFSQ
jgi:hypothetical protein